MSEDIEHTLAVGEDWLDEDGYPTDAALERIEKWDYKEGWQGLFEFINALWWAPDWGWHEEETTDDIYGPVTQYRISTGGWSGNESLIRAMESNFMFRAFCWVQSRRGGHYIYQLRKDGPTKKT